MKFSPDTVPALSDMRESESAKDKGMMRGGDVSVQEAVLKIITREPVTDTDCLRDMAVTCVDKARQTGRDFLNRPVIATGNSIEIPSLPNPSPDGEVVLNGRHLDPKTDMYRVGEDRGELTGKWALAELENNPITESGNHTNTVETNSHTTTDSNGAEVRIRVATPMICTAQIVANTRSPFHTALWQEMKEAIPSLESITVEPGKEDTVVITVTKRTTQD